MNNFKEMIRDILPTHNPIDKKMVHGSDPFLYPASGQFHSLAVETDMWEAFVLILETDGDTCQVTPGSMDPSKGGSSDILIPSPGNNKQYWTLNLELKQKLHVDALLPGFARLTPSLLNYVKYGLNKFELGEPLGKNFRFCLPYIGENDSRMVYRDKLRQMITRCSQKFSNSSGLFVVDPESSGIAD